MINQSEVLKRALMLWSRSATQGILILLCTYYVLVI